MAVMNYIRKIRMLRIPALLASATLLWVAAPTNAQETAPTPNNAPMQNETRAQNPDNEFTRQELARFDQFLDEHRPIGEELRRDPRLIDDQDYLQKHPELQRFLQDHPRVREEIKLHPDAFMHAEERFDRREDQRGGDINREELARFDHFLDSHRDIADELRKDPSLVDNRDYLQHHAELETFLHDHPQIREQIRAR